MAQSFLPSLKQHWARLSRSKMPTNGDLSFRRISTRRISFRLRNRVRVRNSIPFFKYYSRIRVRVRFSLSKFIIILIIQMKFGELKFGETKRNPTNIHTNYGQTELLTRGRKKTLTSERRYQNKYTHTLHNMHRKLSTCIIL